MNCACGKTNLSSHGYLLLHPGVAACFDCIDREKQDPRYREAEVAELRGYADRMVTQHGCLPEQADAVRRCADALEAEDTCRRHDPVWAATFGAYFAWGVRRADLTMDEVVTAMREAADAAFPGCFIVEPPEAPGHGVGLRVVGEDDYLVVWFTWDDYDDDDGPAFVGGNHPRIGPFGYWIMSVICHGIAARTGARIYDDGGYHTEKAPRPTFRDYLTQGGSRPFALMLAHFTALYGSSVPPVMKPYLNDSPANC